MKKSLQTSFYLILAVCLIATEMFAQKVGISTFKQRSFNDTISKGEVIAGRVTVANQFRNTCYMQDGTGGLAIFNTNFRNGVKVGDSVEITGGTLTEFQATTGQPGTGLSQISGAKFIFTVIPGDPQPPAPTTFAIASIGEAAEGLLIKMRKVKFRQTGAFQGEKNYSVQNSNGDTIQIRIDGGTEIAVNNLQIPTGEIDLIGVVSQFRGTYQIVPRFATDLGATVDVDNVPKNKTFDVMAWNIKRFMDDKDTTIKDKQRQFESAKAVIDSGDADLIALEEVSNPAAFTRLVDTLATPSEGVLATQILQDQKMAFIWKKSTVTKISSDLAVNGGAEAWANGRFPLRLTFNATVDGTTRKINAFVIHAKATTGSTDAERLDALNRRKTDAETFYAYLNNFYGSEAVIVLGDFNDDVTKSVVGTGNPSPYKVFVDDTQNWKVATLELSQNGLASYIGGTQSMLDHIIVSNEIVPGLYRTKLEAPQAYLSSYTSTVSDHVPVYSRIYLSSVTVDVQEPVVVEGTSMKVAPNPASANAMMEVVNETEGMLTLRVCDMMGNTVMTLHDGMMPAQIRVFTIPVQELASGMYSVQLIKNGAVRTQQITVVK